MLTNPDVYPSLAATRPETPNRLYALPIVGFLFKAIILIPVSIWLALLGIAVGVMVLVNSFVVLFTGAYMQAAYDLLLGWLRLSVKVFFFMWGFTDRYPGFGFEIEEGGFGFDIGRPEEPNRLFAFPLLGGIVRVVLLIPYIIYSSVLDDASAIALVVTSFPVLFVGKYPESTYELMRDAYRVTAASECYIMGLSDRYPSFWISMNHQTVKIVLIVLGAIVLLGNMAQAAGSGGG